MSPRHRYVILRGGIPVYTTDDVDMLLPYLWGRLLRPHYIVFDYERPYPLDTGDLVAWIAPLKAAAGECTGFLEERGP